MEGGAAALGFHFDGSGAVATILGAIVRRKNFEFGNGFGIGVNVQRGVGAIVHVVATVELPVVVFGTPAVHAVGDVAIDADLAFIGACLVDNPRSQSDELGEITAVQHELIDLLASHGRSEGGGLGFHLSDAFAGYFHYFSNGAHGQLHVNADLLGNIQHDFAGRVFLEAFCGYDEVIGATWQTGDDVSAVRVCGGRAR